MTGGHGTIINMANYTVRKCEEHLHNTNTHGMTWCAIHEVCVVQAYEV